MENAADLRFFVLLMRHGSLARASQDIGITPSAASKRLAALEQRLGCRLLQRTTRRLRLTPEGERYLTEGSRLLLQLDGLEQSLTGGKAQPKGSVRVDATMGFGRQHVAPALSTFTLRYPEVTVQLHLGDRPLDMVAQGIDLQIRFGTLPDSRWTSRRLALNRRLLCAAPRYLARAGEPVAPGDLARHACLFIREGDETYGTWQFTRGRTTESVKVTGPLTTNDGTAALHWALDGHGVLARSQWEIAPHVRDGSLIVLLPEWRLPDADIMLVMPSRTHLPVKTRVLVDHLLETFKDRRSRGDPALGPW